MISKYKILSRANESFTEAKYEEALRNYALVLHDYPNSKEAYTGAILSEMALSGDISADALFDYYTVLKEENAEEADSIMAEIFESMDGSIENSIDALAKALQDPLQEKLMYENGIRYEDFRELVEQDGDFKRIFENIMFSTRVIITEKEDFIDFLDRLLHNDYKEMALNYLESAVKLYPNEPSLLKLVEEIKIKD